MLNKRPGKSFDRPVDDLEKGDEAEAKTESKEAAQGRDELDWTHSDPPFHFYRKKKLLTGKATAILKGSNLIIHALKNKMMFHNLISPIMVSLPKKMLTTAMSSSHALYSVST